MTSLPNNNVGFGRQLARGIPPSSIDVYTWNIGNKRVHQKGQDLISSVTRSKRSDIMVFGFQEISLGSLKTITNLLRKTFETPGGRKQSVKEKNINWQQPWQEAPLKNYILLSQNHTCSMSSTLSNSFVIATLIFVRQDRNLENLKIKPVIKDCKLLTKGFLCIPFSINNKIINVINTHLPFKDDLTTYAQLFNRILDSVPPNETTILIGDLNSRSLILDACYKKDVKYQCKIRGCTLEKQLAKLHSMNLMDTIKLPQSVAAIQLQHNATCGIPDDVLLSNGNSRVFPRFLKAMIDKDFLYIFLKQRKSTNKTVSEEFWQITKDHTLTDTLINLKIRLQNYKEMKIDFYPTYKREAASGRFSLSKGTKGRLPGYADRVIFKNPYGLLVPQSYDSIPIKGNDHLPVLQTFKLRTNPKTQPITRTPRFSPREEVKFNNYTYDV
jgi:hypothetical protein